MGITKIFDGKKNLTIVPEDEEISISSFNEKDDNAITPSKMLTFSIVAINILWISCKM
jgi:hypothetical protein